ncbi:MAG: M12 family metallo-peptidase [Weeksellaceae bacterium]|nr:T9SS type A sorting domain-containing protein [Bacteroidota bacterium]MCG2781272.1 M12 family metallo-peptidase [Weeksellaceae bacterium]
MKRIFQLCCSLVFFSFGFSQNLKPIAEKVKNSHTANKTFVKYSPFTVDPSAQKQALYKAAADDITVMKLNSTELQRINSERPEALEMNFPFEGKNITVELVKNNFFTQDFKLNTDKGYINYTPGVYYQGIVKGDNESLVAISFFNDDVVGVTSIKDIGNIVIGKAKNADSYVSYNDQKLKGDNPFSCSAEDLIENQKMPAPSYDPKTMTAKKTDNCVRIYYEAGFGPYTQNGSNVTTTTNWVTAMHNNISTLYANDGVTVALSAVMVWTTTDPYAGTPSEILNQFRNTRTSFNGDIAQLLRNPATTSIAWVNALCGTYKYSYSGVNFAYANVPTYSWNIEAMTHEIGHNLGSPHTHDCSWNGNNTRIDGCGPASGNAGNGTCAAGPLPTGTGGTIMSYCHLVSSVGINFANGFGPQPGALIRNTVNSKGCLGTDCVASCALTITGMSIANVTNNSAAATIIDNTATSWKYKLAKMDGTVVVSGVSSSKVLNFTNLNEGTYYNVSVGTECSGPQAYAYEQLILTDANWCSGIQFTDPGGASANYGDNQIITKTFYPANASDKLKLTFTEFDTESGFDFMNVYNGPTTGSPRFANGTQLSGNTIPGPFQSTHATGAITVRFISDGGVSGTGWNSTFDCLTLATGETSMANSVKISQTAVKNIFSITSKDKILSYSVLDASGKLVKNAVQVNVSEEKLDLSAYPKGTYMVSVTTAKETVTKKVIK